VGTRLKAVLAGEIFSDGEARTELYVGGFINLARVTFVEFLDEPVT